MDRQLFLVAFADLFGLMEVEHPAFPVQPWVPAALGHTPFGDAMFEDHALTTNDLREIAENAAVSRAVIALYHAYRAQTESVRALAAKVYDGRDFAGVNPAHLPLQNVAATIALTGTGFAGNSRVTVGGTQVTSAFDTAR